MNREKVALVAKRITEALLTLKFTADETVALLKCLDHLNHSQAIEKDMIVTTKRNLLDIIEGRKSLTTLEYQ